MASAGVTSSDVAAVGVLAARSLGGRVAVAAAMAWGLAWIAVGRTGDEPRSVATAVAAAAVAVVVLAAVVPAVRDRWSGGGLSGGGLSGGRLSEGRMSEGRASMTG